MAVDDGILLSDGGGPGDWAATACECETFDAEFDTGTRMSAVGGRLTLIPPREATFAGTFELGADAFTSVVIVAVIATTLPANLRFFGGLRWVRTEVDLVAIDRLAAAVADAEALVTGTKGKALGTGVTVAPAMSEVSLTSSPDITSSLDIPDKKSSPPSIAAAFIATSMPGCLLKSSELHERPPPSAAAAADMAMTGRARPFSPEYISMSSSPKKSPPKSSFEVGGMSSHSVATGVAMGNVAVVVAAGERCLMSMIRDD